MGRTVIKTGVFYRDSELEVTEGFRSGSGTSLDNVAIDGFAWRVFVVESYERSPKYMVFPTAEEALSHGRATIKGWLDSEAVRETEAKEYRKLLNRVFETKDAAEKHGCTSAIEYICHECGTHFWAQWRSKYSLGPSCPLCKDESDDLFITEATDTSISKLFEVLYGINAIGFKTKQGNE